MQTRSHGSAQILLYCRIHSVIKFESDKRYLQLKTGFEELCKSYSFLKIILRFMRDIKEF